jgi:hypothetical protein
MITCRATISTSTAEAEMKRAFISGLGSRLRLFHSGPLCRSSWAYEVFARANNTMQLVDPKLSPDLL